MSCEWCQGSGVTLLWICEACGGCGRYEYQPLRPVAPCSSDEPSHLPRGFAEAFDPAVLYPAEHFFEASIPLIFPKPYTGEF